ncbi:uncharacterized protein LOC130110688 [Lampris incognitus]|uniref:uncharacterized protein LOC130110688 n=1 Tax=Lampris incognitus TaxID=2546036 RepID=UPI0024B4FBF5|nr:uncharacterized protein LOC130110688 [Lampris incognitus]
MSTTGRHATNPHNVKEIDSVKESISDIINQLQDIDPARLSFSPFLDLDTQISLAPVSDSPESSVEELRSPSRSVTGSQRSLELIPAADQQKTPDSCNKHPGDSLMEKRGAHRQEEGVLDESVSTPAVQAHALEDAMENSIGIPNPAPLGDVPNGTDTAGWSPESTHLDCTSDEGRLLIGPPPESVELTVWHSEGRGDTCRAEAGASDTERCCCRCRCCLSGRVPALCSALASLLCAAGILYTLYFYIPIKPPDCPDVGSRIAFSLCCCVVAAVPILLAMLSGAVCQFCTGSLNPVEPFPRRRAIQQLFVSASLEQFLLYALNLVVMATLLPQDELKLVPMLVALFILGRLVYWISLHTCSSWRGLGSGLTMFPLITMVALNLFCMYNLGLKQPLFGRQDALYNQATPSYSMEMSQSPSGKSDNVLPTDILDAQ